jgi:protein TonB
VLSICCHLAVVGSVGLLFLPSPLRQKTDVEVVVIENPRLAPRPLELAPPKPVIKEKPQAVAHKVFGISAKALTDNQAEQGPAIKAGNTVATTPDHETLKPGDAEQLPIPTDEYLVTSMPSISQEIRIPYPPEAKQKGIEGPVVVDLLIDESGHVRQASLVSGPGSGLDEAALSAMQKFTFHPARVADKAVAVKIRYTYRFVLEK